MKVFIEMGEEEARQFMKFRDEKPKLMAEVLGIKRDLRDLAEKVAYALGEADEKEICVSREVAADLIKTANKYL